MKYDIVVTSRRCVVDFLLNNRIIDESTTVINSVSKSNINLIRGKNVVGSLPMGLACYCRTYTHVGINIPKHLRNVALTDEELEKYVTPLHTYSVRMLDDSVDSDDVAKTSMARFIYKTESNWKLFNQYLMDGGNPVEHPMFHACSVVGQFAYFEQFVNAMCSEEHILEFKNRKAEIRF